MATALGEALERAGFDPLINEIRRSLSRWRNNGISLSTMVTEVERAYADVMPDRGLDRFAGDSLASNVPVGQQNGDAEGLQTRADGRAPIAPASPPQVSGQGLARPVDDPNSDAATGQPQGDGGGLLNAAGEALNAVPPPSPPIRIVHKEPSEADRRIALLVAKKAAKFWYEIDGTDIHDISLGHARSIARRYGTGHYVCSVMASKHRHLPDTMTFGQLATDVELELLVRQGQEFASNGL